MNLGKKLLVVVALLMAPATAWAAAEINDAASCWPGCPCGH